MRFIYSLIVSLVWQLLKLIALANPKIAKFVSGRKQVIKTLKKHLSKTDKVVWIHAASLGEYEQGLPILEKLKKDYPEHKVLLTFFSPSGYEVKKDTSPADIVTYLPLDTPQKVKSFLNVSNPKMAIFIKYEIWPNYLSELKKRNTPTILISARFKSDKIFFKSYGRFMRNALKKFTYLYVQDLKSLDLLKSIGMENVTVTGDTRLDRVSEILKRNNSLPFMDQFCKQTKCLVAGSTWPDDEVFLIDYINNSKNDEKYIIAPHNIKEEHIQSLKNSIQRKTLCYSSLPEKIPKETAVIIIDTIGLLTKIYSYATVAYVGGGFATGLHNTLEPAVFGIPVIIGPKYKGFLEAEDLVKLGGVIPISNRNEFFNSANSLLNDEQKCTKVGEINSQYILINKGASIQIMKGIRTLI
ncbi:glycosyltransferase N-terminal domain-containing protein [Maribacter sp. PR1]|uniref:3-deoxy-D-manno-octulosonic acid transferase n=1 Tax=Maribacter cobaltidurans TaxID=1178778 RepID=A0ABU7IPB2_9FLAO|nr:MULTISPECIES: glycosyltransferase N-terminal domain-containing protein [Maribacter]MDC6387396.1 glycosyltransferase N-terminal domain-containing protein [Maribacter sp. PR1]MEE1974781.1 glycosyltransferase N-terminal domain-containing protein [Maribacter cobaltidurans]